MFGINTTDLMILIFIALFVVGPERMQHYAKQLPRQIRKIREMSDGAKSSIQDEIGEEDFNKLKDLRKYDPRQYDPRKIIKDALNENFDGVYDDAEASVKDMSGKLDSTVSSAKDAVSSTVSAGSSVAVGAVAAGVATGNTPEENVRLAREAAKVRPISMPLPEGFKAPFDPEAT